MSNLGVFGENIVEETAYGEVGFSQRGMTLGRPRGFAIGGFGGGGMPASDAAPAGIARKSASSVTNFPLAEDRDAKSDEPAGAGEFGADPGSAALQPTVRKNFADTAYWAAVVAN